MSCAEDAFARECDARGVTYLREYRFCDWRKWRADFALPGGRVLVEIEGRGRHQTYVGFRNDCEKYLTAAQLGWIVLRFPAGDFKPSKSRAQWPGGAGDWAAIVDAFCRRKEPVYAV